MKWNEIIELVENEEEFSKLIRKEGERAYKKAVRKTVEGIIEDLEDLYRENLCNRYVTWDGADFKSTLRKCLPYFVGNLSEREEDKLRFKCDGQYEEYQNALEAERSIYDNIVAYYDDGGKGVFEIFNNSEIWILRKRGESVEGRFDIAFVDGSNLMLFRVCECCREEYKIVLHKALNYIGEYFMGRWE